MKIHLRYYIFYVILLRILIYFGVTMYFASLPPEEIYDHRGDIICAIAQWSMMIQAVITTERQTEPVKIRVGHLDNAFRYAHGN